MCKRPEQSDLTINYRKTSFRNAALILVGYDTGSDGNILETSPRSYLTAGYRQYGDEPVWYVDVVCSCLNQKEYCLKKTYKEKPLFLHHFLQAEEYKNAQDLEISKKQIDKVINNFISYKCEY